MLVTVYVGGDVGMNLEEQAYFILVEQSAGPS